MDGRCEVGCKSLFVPCPGTLLSESAGSITCRRPSWHVCPEPVRLATGRICSRDYNVRLHVPYTRFRLSVDVSQQRPGAQHIALRDSERQRGHPDKACTLDICIQEADTRKRAWLPAPQAGGGGRFLASSAWWRAA